MVVRLTMPAARSSAVVWTVAIMLAQRPAHDVETACQRGIAKQKEANQIARSLVRRPPQAHQALIFVGTPLVPTIS